MQENKELTISSIGDLQIALMENDNEAIRRYIERLDRETANAAMTQAGKHFGFPTVEVEGVVRTSSVQLARVFGYKTTQGLQKILERRGIMGVKMGGFIQNVQSLLREKLGLDASDHSSTLYDWPAFLIVGMNSTNEESSVVQLYLMRAEKISRIGIVAVRRLVPEGKLPDAAQASAMAKFTAMAERGNPIATYILENYYNVPANRLLQRAETELSSVAGIISQYLHILIESDTSQWQIEKGISEEENQYLQGETTHYLNAFTAIGKQRNLSTFYKNARQLGLLLSREAKELENHGWRRSQPRTINGHREFRYELFT